MIIIPLILLLALSSEMSNASGTESHLLGGHSVSNPEDPSNMKAATFAVAALNTQGDIGRGTLGDAMVGKVELVSIESVSTQVVAGINYYITFSVKDEKGKTHLLDVTVWSRPWLENKNDVNDPAWRLTKVKIAGASE
jgi:hypothetical protein